MCVTLYELTGVVDHLMREPQRVCCAPPPHAGHVLATLDCGRFRVVKDRVQPLSATCQAGETFDQFAAVDLLQDATDLFGGGFHHSFQDPRVLE